MSNKFFTGSICLTSIPEELIVEANGKKFLNIAVFANKDGENKYGNTHYITCSPKKEERKEGVNYIIGNLKERGGESANPVDAVNPPKGDVEQTEQPQPSGSTDDLPF